MPEAPPTGPVVIVTGALAPYTHVLYEALAAHLARPLWVLACSARERSRQWELPPAQGYRFEVLPGLRWHRSAVTNHYVNPAVFSRLASLRPAAVIVNDFSPTMLMAAYAARRRGIAYGVRTDGVPATDPGSRSLAHRAMRHALIRPATFGIGGSRGSMELLQSYGLATERTFLSPLFPAWTPTWTPAAEANSADQRPFDLLFCGRLDEEVKGARFFVDVVLGCLANGHRLKIRVAGDGPLRQEMATRFAQAGVEARFDGFVQQDGLEAVYRSARLFLFPSRGDVWGIVVNEALQCGSVVIASPHCGAATELLAARDCGLVRPLDVSQWVETTLALLDDGARRAELQATAAQALLDFTPERAVAAYLAPLNQLLASDCSRER